MRKEMQSSRYSVISYIVWQMGLDIVEASAMMDDLQKSGLVILRPNGKLLIREIGGMSWKGLRKINTWHQSAIISYLWSYLRMSDIRGHETGSQGGLCGLQRPPRAVP